VYGEVPAHSDTNLEDIRKALEKLDFVVLQDVFIRSGVCSPAAWGGYNWQRLKKL
jgi:predicted molibdopterin-dependent oxidoreductase YjgC